MPIWLPSYRWLHLLVVGGDWSTEASQFEYSADTFCIPEQEKTALQSPEVTDRHRYHIFS